MAQEFLNYLDRLPLVQNGQVSLQSYFAVLSVSVVFFAFSLVPIHFVSLLSSTYRQAGLNRRVPWMSYSMSVLHAPISASFALFCFLKAEVKRPNFHYGAANSDVVCVLFTLGYMVVDTVLFLSKPREFTGLTALLIHHFVIMLTYSIGLFNEPIYGVYFMLGFQVQEVVNPFLNVRWFLLECKMKDSVLYPINGIAILLSFFFSRVLFGSFVLYRFVAYLPSEVYSSTKLMVGSVGAVCFQVLQYYWFALVFSMVLKYIFPKKGNKTEQQKEE